MVKEEIYAIEVDEQDLTEVKSRFAILLKHKKERKNVR
jgi:hypothetical protein